MKLLIIFLWMVCVVVATLLVTGDNFETFTKSVYGRVALGFIIFAAIMSCCMIEGLAW